MLKKQLENENAIMRHIIRKLYDAANAAEQTNYGSPERRELFITVQCTIETYGRDSYYFPDEPLVHGYLHPERDNA